MSGPTRVLSATRTANASAHTVGVVLEQLLFTVLGRGADGQPDRVLNAPTNEAWIDPWERHLRGLGVDEHNVAALARTTMRDACLTTNPRAMDQQQAEALFRAAM